MFICLTNDPDLLHDMETITKEEDNTKYNYETYVNESLLKSVPKYNNQQRKEAISLEITALIDRKWILCL